MAKAKKVKQISFTLPNRVGLLSEVTQAVSGAKVNILAIYAYEKGDEACFSMLTDSPTKTKRALSSIGAELREEEVIAVEMPNRVGELQKVAQRIGDGGINIEYVYGTTSSGRTSTCIFKTSDNNKAIRIINK